MPIHGKQLVSSIFCILQFVGWPVLTYSSPNFNQEMTWPICAMLKILEHQIWLVVDLPLWKIYWSVGMIIPNIWKNVPNHQPDINWLYKLQFIPNTHWVSTIWRDSFTSSALQEVQLLAEMAPRDIFDFSAAVEPLNPPSVLKRGSTARVLSYCHPSNHGKTVENHRNMVIWQKEGII